MFTSYVVEWWQFKNFAGEMLCSKLKRDLKCSAGNLLFCFLVFQVMVPNVQTGASTNPRAVPVFDWFKLRWL